MEIPSEFLNSQFLMNPETDDLIFASELREGMIVFAEDPMGRYYIDLTKDNPIENLDEVYQRQALQKNRWMRVSNLWEDRPDRTFRFVGIFSDGTKATIYAPHYSGWYVKKASIPGPIFSTNVEIQYNVAQHQGRHCTRCPYGHIYNGICTTPGCAKVKN